MLLDLRQQSTTAKTERLRALSQDKINAAFDHLRFRVDLHKTTDMRHYQVRQKQSNRVLQSHWLMQISRRIASSKSKRLFVLPHSYSCPTVFIKYCIWLPDSLLYQPTFVTVSIRTFQKFTTCVCERALCSLQQILRDRKKPTKNKQTNNKNKQTIQSDQSF